MNGRFRSVRHRVLAVLAVLVGGGLAVSACGGSDRTDGGPGPAGRSETVAPATEAEQTATAYLRALSTYDEAAAAALLAADSELGGQDGDPATWRTVLRWNEAVGFEMTPGVCTEAATTGAGIKVRCPYVFHTLGSDEMGLGPFEGSTYVVVVDHGMVVDATDRMEYLSNGYSRTMWEPFGTWVATERPEDFSVMFVDGGPRITEDSVPVWERAVRAYVAERSVA